MLSVKSDFFSHFQDCFTAPCLPSARCLPLQSDTFVTVCKPGNFEITYTCAAMSLRFDKSKMPKVFIIDESLCVVAGGGAGGGGGGVGNFRKLLTSNLR